MHEILGHVASSEGAVRAVRELRGKPGLLEVALKAKVTCSCFQGRCLTKDTCANDNGMRHQCLDPRYPILSYGLNREGQLQCGCSAKLHHHEYHREF